MFLFLSFHFSILRSVDLSTTTDSKQFQELLLERTKAFAAQTEALKSSNTDGKFSSFCFFSHFPSILHLHFIKLLLSVLIKLSAFSVANYF
jgi:hypothetical protein